MDKETLPTSAEEFLPLPEDVHAVDDPVPEWKPKLEIIRRHSHFLTAAVLASEKKLHRYISKYIELRVREIGYTCVTHTTLTGYTKVILISVPCNIYLSGVLALVDSFVISQVQPDHPPLRIKFYVEYLRRENNFYDLKVFFFIENHATEAPHIRHEKQIIDSLLHHPPNKRRRH